MGFEYWLARCLNGKQTLLELVTNDEKNEFMMAQWLLKVNTQH